MKLPKTIAFLQIALGLSGLLLCFILYLTYSSELQEAAERLDDLAGDTEAQAKVGEEILTQWTSLLASADRSMETHQTSLGTTRTSLQQLAESTQQWQAGLVGFQKVSSDASQIFEKLQGQLPIKIPMLNVGSREMTIDIPQLELQNETIKLPYPTATVGTRKMELDLGVTKVNFDAPTLNLGTNNRNLTVPVSPRLSYRKENITVPDDVTVSYQEILSEEKQLLIDSASQLRTTAELLEQSQETLRGIQRALEVELLASLDATEDNLRLSRQSMQHHWHVQIPEFQQRLASQQSHLARSQLNFRALRSLIPWLFLFAGILPLAVSLHGLQSWLALKAL